MSIGVAIIFCTVLVLVAWQIDKRKAWRKAMKGIGWVLVTILVIGVSAAIFFLWWLPAQEKRERAAEIESLRKDPVYADIKLGMSQAEVRYLKGEPASTVAATPGRGESWEYRTEQTEGAASVVVVWGRNDARVVGVLCAENVMCPELGWIGVGSHEASVRERFGQPDQDETPSATGNKRMAYRVPHGRILFFLAREAVEAVGIDDGDQFGTP